MNFPIIKRVVVIMVLTCIVIITITSLNHPIFLKWISGSARIIGQPINAIVYTDGKVNKKIKVFHVEKYWNKEPADYFIVYFPNAVNSRLQYLCLNRKESFAGSPSSTNIRDYDLIAGILIQSEVGSKFTPIQNPVKGFDYNPELDFSDGQIKLKMPPEDEILKFDSLRLVL